MKTRRITYSAICPHLFPGVFYSIIRETLVTLVKSIDTPFPKTPVQWSPQMSSDFLWETYPINGNHSPLPNSSIYSHTARAAIAVLQIKLQIKRCFVDKGHLLELSVTATQESHPAHCTLLRWIHSVVWNVPYLFYFAKYYNLEDVCPQQLLNLCLWRYSKLYWTMTSVMWLDSEAGEDWTGRLPECPSNVTFLSDSV